MNHSNTDFTSPDSPHFKVDELQDESKAPAETKAIAAWEEVSEGRFMPRRVRGSCVGRALG